MAMTDYLHIVKKIAWSFLWNFNFLYLYVLSGKYAYNTCKNRKVIFQLVSPWDSTKAPYIGEAKNWGWESIRHILITS